MSYVGYRPCVAHAIYARLVASRGDRIMCAWKHCAWYMANAVFAATGFALTRRSRARVTIQFVPSVCLCGTVVINVHDSHSPRDS